MRALMLGLAAAILAFPATAQPESARRIINNCLSVCAAVGREGIPLEDLAASDRCVGHLKGVAAAVSATVGSERRAGRAASCAAVFLQNRTARSPDKDPVLQAACRFGEWGATRSNLMSRPAAEASLAWMNADGCRPK